MAKPIEFEFSNNSISGGSSANDLPCFTDDTKEKNVITCWQLTDDDIMDIVKSKRIYLRQLTYGYPIPPMIITTICPIVKTEDK